MFKKENVISVYKYVTRLMSLLLIVCLKKYDDG